MGCSLVFNLHQIEAISCRAGILTYHDINKEVTVQVDVLKSLIQCPVKAMESFQLASVDFGLGSR